MKPNKVVYIYNYHFELFFHRTYHIAMKIISQRQIVVLQ